MIYEITIQAHKISLAVSANNSADATKMAVTAVRQALEDVGATMIWTTVDTQEVKE